MTASALQLPFLAEPAKRLGARRFRKQVLPVGTVEHPGQGPLEFTRQRLAALVDRFRAGAYDMVPLTLTNDRNQHVDDPERVRGEITDLELSGDGLYAQIEATDRGARLIEENPRLPVSVRLVRQAAGEALAHVAMTLDPVAKGLEPWQAVDFAADCDVIDLSSGGWALDPAQEARKLAEATWRSYCGMSAMPATTAELSRQSDGLDQATRDARELAEAWGKQFGWEAR